MSAHLVFEGGKEKWFERMRILTRKNIEDRHARRAKNRELESLSPVQIARAAKEAHQAYLPKMGVCSFAGSGDNILMWSHYSTDHEGVCLEFALAQDLQTFIPAINVTHSEEYPVINWAVADPHEEFKRTLLMKDKAWRYENERRIVVPDAARTHFDFRSDALTGIIFGCRAGRIIEDKVTELIAERTRRRMPPVKLYRAQVHPSRYELCIGRTRTA